MNIRGVLPIALLFGVSAASAEVISFDALPNEPYVGSFVGPSVSEFGYLILNASSNAKESFISWGPSTSFYMGSPSIFNDVHRGKTVVSRLDGAIFSVSSIDLAPVVKSAQYGATVAAETVTFYGAKRDGVGTVTKTFPLGRFNGLVNNFVFDGNFTDLVALYWNQGSVIGVRHQFDNIVVFGATQ